MLALKPVCEQTRSVDDTPPSNAGRISPQNSLSLCLRVSVTLRLAHALDSLVRVSRRVAWNHLTANNLDAFVLHTNHRKNAVQTHCMQHAIVDIQTWPEEPAPKSTRRNRLYRKQAGTPEAITLHAEAHSHLPRGLFACSQYLLTYHCKEVQQAPTALQTRQFIRIYRAHRPHDASLNLYKALLIPCASLLTVSRTFNFLFKVLFIFPSRYLFAIGLVSIFSFRRSLPPTLGCIPKQPDSPRVHRERRKRAVNGAVTLCGVLFQATWAHFPASWKHFFRLQFDCTQGTVDYRLELFLLHSPLLKESLLVSFPPLINMLKFSG